MSFCAAVNCIDGRVQLPVIEFLRNRFQVQYVDIISEPGPCLILAERTDQRTVESILSRVRLSVLAHQTTELAVVAHHDCAGNPVGKSEQLEHLRQAAAYLASVLGELEVIAVWVNDKFEAYEVPLSTAGPNEAKSGVEDRTR